MWMNLIQVGGGAMILNELIKKAIDIKHSQEKTVRSTRTKNMLIGTGIGTVIGVAAGILYAPKSGKETRQQIVDETEKVAKSMKDNMDAVKTKVADSVKEAGSKLYEAAEKTGSKLNEAAEKTESKLSEAAEKGANAAKEALKEKEDIKPKDIKK